MNYQLTREERDKILELLWDIISASDDVGLITEDMATRAREIEKLIS